MLKNKHLLIIGGTSGMGLELANQALTEKGKVTIVGRSKHKLEQALSVLGNHSACTGLICDVSNEHQVIDLYQQVGEFDYLVVTAAGDVVYKPFETISLDEANTVIDNKLIGAFLLVKHGKPLMNDSSAIVFTSGINAFIPPGKSSIVSAVNGALIAFARALAVELRPIRVNTVSPGWVDTPIWSNLATDDAKLAMFDDMAQKLPAGRIGTPSDIASAIMLLLTNSYITGTTLEVDGGRRLL